MVPLIFVVFFQCQEEIAVAVKRLSPDAPGNNENVQARRLSLQFTNKPRPKIYSGKEIKVEDGAKIKLALVDASSRLVVESGPEAEAKVKIVLLEATEEDDDVPWTSKMFSDRIVEGRAETKLSGKQVLKLTRGIGIIGNIKLASSSDHMKKGLFKLGASVSDTIPGIHIEEGKSESFTGQDYRILYRKKSEIPELSDHVWRLNRIAKDKLINVNLNEHGIYNVKDFLQQLFKDPEGLRRISGMRNKDWEVAVAHARTCKFDQSVILEEHVVQNIQVPRMVGECSTMNGGSPSAVPLDLSVNDFWLDEQSMGEDSSSSIDIEEFMRDLVQEFEDAMEGKLGGNQTNQSEDQIRKPRLRKNWRVLMSVVTITRSMSRKRVCLGKPPVQKRQKVM